MTKVVSTMVEFDVAGAAAGSSLTEDQWNHTFAYDQYSFFVTD